jgi:type VI secretion system protein VasG
MDEMDLSLKPLIEKLNRSCRDALEAAAGLCLSRTNYEVDLEHFLLKLAERSDSDFKAILAYCECDSSRLTKDLLTALDKLKTGNARTPVLSPRLVDLIRDAWMLSSVDYGASKVRSGHIVVALLMNIELAPLAREISKEFSNLTFSLDSLRNKFNNITVDSAEARESARDNQSHKNISDPSAPPTSTTALDQYTIDLTAQARSGHIDPILGREAEIRQIIDILIRRRQNNPILTGEAGVGKTAVVEGFAQRVAQGDVPSALKDVVVRTLDLGLLQAGAGVKGEFEQRLKSVIDEVKGAVPPVILFIDEAHTMIGAGGQAGQSDAANLLKPAPIIV